MFPFTLHQTLNMARKKHSFFKCNKIFKSLLNKCERLYKKYTKNLSHLPKVNATTPLSTYDSVDGENDETTLIKVNFTWLQ